MPSHPNAHNPAAVAPNDANHAAYLRHAVALSRLHMEAGDGGPFGAVIVKDGSIIGEGWNQVTSSNDPTAHAEVMAIRQACRQLGNFSLAGAVLYSSCEPCPMCLAAAYWARLTAIHFANTRQQAADIGFDDAFLYDELAKPGAARALPAYHLPLDEAQSVFAAWLAMPGRVAY